MPCQHIYRAEQSRESFLARTQIYRGLKFFNLLQSMVMEEEEENTKKKATIINRR
jgi:hypothetical protein